MAATNVPFTTGRPVFQVSDRKRNAADPGLSLLLLASVLEADASKLTRAQPLLPAGQPLASGPLGPLAAALVYFTVYCQILSLAPSRASF